MAPTETSLALQVHQTLRDMDRYLRDRDYLALMGTTGANQVLTLLQAFNEQVEHFHQQRFEVSGPDTHLLERHILAGCRLSADLMESLQERMMDSIQQGETDIEQMNRRLREQLKARHQAVSVMQRLQAAKQTIRQSGETLGLGILL